MVFWPNHRVHVIGIDFSELSPSGHECEYLV
jgi:hypothetical protein